LKERWARLTDGDLEAVDGQAARLLGLLQARYGYARPRAERELLAVLDEAMREGPRSSRHAARPGAARPGALRDRIVTAPAAERGRPLTSHTPGPTVSPSARGTISERALRTRTISER
jgi:uncharacterized protein YjbJ (UPF0337 family)